MGTSISQASPRNTNWKPVLAGYSSDNVHESRLINEIWRASEKESISESIKSNAVYSCFEAVRSSKTFQEALQKANLSIRESKNNSLIAEFAKRVIPLAFQSNKPLDQWAGKFFCEVTNYIISRDSSGFVGDMYRNKSVKELINFKKSVVKRVDSIVVSGSKTIRSQKDWNSFVDRSISKLKTSN